MPTAKKLKVGVIGVGHLGKEHARIYASLPQTELVGICDIDFQCAEKAVELKTEKILMGRLSRQPKDIKNPMKKRK